MEKVIKDGKVAVCISVGYGAGWSTWNDDELAEKLLFHPSIVNAILSGHREDIDGDWLAENLGDEYYDVYYCGAEQLMVEWLPEGTVFKVDEYDGAESIYIISTETTFKA